MSKKIKFCLLLFVIFCVTFATSENVAAIGFLAYRKAALACADSSGGLYTYENLSFAPASSNGQGYATQCKDLAMFYVETTATINNSVNSAYFTIIGKTNIVIQRVSNWHTPMAVPTPMFNTGDIVAASVYYAGSDNVYRQLNISDSQIQAYDTVWKKVENGVTNYYETLTVNYTIYGSGAPFITNAAFRVWFSRPNRAAICTGTYPTWFESVDTAPTISFNMNEIPGLITNIIGNQTLQMTQEEQERFEASQASDQELDTSSLEGKATSLLGAMSTFVTSLYTLHTTDCIIPQGASVNGLDFSGADLCSYDLPAPISAIASLSLIFIVVPLGFNVCKRLINTVDWVFK